jgi:hypothetical protein
VRALLLVALLALVPSPARAQRDEERWLVVGTVPLFGRAEVAESVRVLGGALSGVPVITHAAAATALTGSPPSAPDPVLEAALGTSGAIVLDYGSTWIERVRRLDDARELAARIGAGVVVIVTLAPARDLFWLDRVDLPLGRTPRARIVVPVARGEALSPGPAREAGRALVEARSLDLRPP